MNPLSFTSPNFNKLYDTFKIEPLSLNNVHYANKTIYTTEGELVNVNNGGSVDISSVINYVTINSSNCFLTQISVNESNLIGIAPITLECECVNFISDGTQPKLPSNIIQAKNQIQIASSIEGIVTYSRTISVNAGASSFSNPHGSAKSYATELKNKIPPFQLSFKGRNVRSSPTILISESTSDDRYNATSSVQQNYLINLVTPYAGSKGVIKESIEEDKNFIDEVTTITQKISVEGGIAKNQSEITELLKDLSFKSTKRPGSDFKIISKNLSSDEERNSSEMTVVWSNDPTISMQGNKISCTFNCSLDLLTDNNTFGYLCQVQPISNISASDSTRGDLVTIKDIKDLKIPVLGDFPFVETSREEGQRKGQGAYGSLFSINFIDASNGFYKEFYEVDIQGNYNPGLPQYSETPILDGKGKWYIEDLNVFSNGSFSVTVNGKSDKPMSDPGNIVPLISSGKFCEGCKEIVMQDQFYYDKTSKNFSFTFAQMGEDKSFIGK